jgi:hypothetical protein
MPFIIVSCLDARMLLARAGLIQALGTPECSDPKQAGRTLLVLVPLPRGGLTTHSTRAASACLSFAGLEGWIQSFPPG